MKQRNSFTRKLIYGVAIAVLLFPLSLLSSPATVDSPGGTLAQLRTEYRLGQGDLGEIDPASETIKLATLGLRGVAVNLLWEKANHYKKVEDWTNLTTTLEQLAKLQPNFLTFWKYQSWNLSYNVSVEFDDYHDRYYWVRRGIQFLQQGNKYNRDNPVLLSELGWVNGQKIGRSDEHKLYRRLYKADDEFHPTDRTPEQRDNWLVSKSRYLESISAADEKGKGIGRKSPSLFYSAPPKAQMNYAEAIEEEGLFDKAVAAWKRAGQEWNDYGNLTIEHSTGVPLRFNDLEEVEERANLLQERLTGLVDGVEKIITEQLREALTEEQQAAWETPEADRSATQAELAYQVERDLEVTPAKIVEHIAQKMPEKRREAERLAAEIFDLQRKRSFTKSYRQTTNYDYWKLRCEFEQTRSAVQARELVHRAQRAFLNDADPITAKELYEEAFVRWAEVFEEFPQLKEGEGTTGDDIMVFIYEYNEVLEQLDEELPEDFPLWFLIEEFDAEGTFRLQAAERFQKQLDSEAERQDAATGDDASE